MYGLRILDGSLTSLTQGEKEPGSTRMNWRPDDLLRWRLIPR
jgi:hypothetical protein